MKLKGVVLIRVYYTKSVGLNVISAIVHDDPLDLIPGAGYVQGLISVVTQDFEKAQRRLYDLQSDLRCLYDRKEEKNNKLFDILTNIQELEDTRRELDNLISELNE